jgi:hypothetical protein
MAGPWPTAEDARAQPGSAALLKRMVCESLKRELEARRDRSPHAQLGVIVGADRSLIRRAYLQLRAHFDPGGYETHGPDAVALAAQLRSLIEAAYLELGRPVALALRRKNFLLTWLRGILRFLKRM